MSAKGRLIRTLTLLTILALALNPVLAQTGKPESSLRVTVLDPNGAAISSAAVKLLAERDSEQLLQANGRGEVLFSKLGPGKYRLLVEAPGFEPREVSGVKLRAGQNSLEVRLDIERVKEEVAVSESEQERQTDPRNGFTNVLTEEQIAALPDDPEEFEEAIKRMAGPGARITVNGFRGGKLPPKSQIREIRFQLNPYAAENHYQGFIGINIFTKPGLDAWHGGIGFGFRDESLNARNAFAPFRAPEQSRRLSFDLAGPLWKKRTSLSLAFDGTSSYDSKTVVAALPEGGYSDALRIPLRRLNATARVEHALTKTHTILAEYQRNAGLQENLGVGDFDLPERAYSTDLVENLFRFSDSGPISKRLFNELRFQARWQGINSQSATDGTAVLVQNAFNAGGAQVRSDRNTFEIELADNVSFAFEQHSMKAGILLEGGRYESDALQNAGGTFTFASLDDYRAGRPILFRQRVGDPSIEYSQYQFGWYFQDDFRLHKSFTLSFGLRHELQTNLGDANNLAPRVGIAWSPFASGSTTIRAGAGLFYDWSGVDILEQTLRVDGVRQQEIVIRNPGFPDPLSGGSQVVLPPSIITRDPEMLLPYSQQASVSIERVLTKFSRLNASYFYNRGVHQLRSINLNAPVPGLGRPFPDLGNITQVESSADSVRHMMHLSWNATIPKWKLFATVFYMMMHVTNETDGTFSLPSDNFNLRADRGRAGGLPLHRVSAMANFPLYKQFKLGLMFDANSGAPYNITTGFDDNGDTISNDRPQGVGRNSERGEAHYNVSARLNWGIGWGEKGGSGSAPPMVRVIKSDDMLGAFSGGASNKRFRVELYLQVSNLLNQTNLVNYSGVQTSPFFGRAISALPGRRMETGMKFNF